MTEPGRGLSFGSAAQRYERYRPDYPDELADVVLQYAGRPVRRALEVGAGTGKATRLFAARGVHVTALEPDPGMADVLVGTTRGMPVQPEVTTFERFETAERFDLLFAAAAWHWTDPATRWARAVGLLAPGGVLALMHSPTEPKDPAVLSAVAQVEQVLPGDDWAAWTLEDIAATDGLTDSTTVRLPGVTTTTAEEFLGLLSTVSAYLVLRPEVRAATLRRIGAALPEQFDLDVTSRLFLARRV